MFLQEHVMESERSLASDKSQKCSCKNIVEILDDGSARRLRYDLIEHFKPQMAVL